VKIFYTRDKVASRDFLCKVLQEYYGIDRPQFERGAHGKPRLSTGTPCFNVTHSGGLTAVAVSKREVGLDLQLRKERDYSALIKRLTPAEREEDFFRVWTAKEAYVKYLGSSLAEEYPSLRFHSGVLYRNGEHTGVSLFFRETADYVLCLCTASPCAVVELKEISLL